MELMDIIRNRRSIRKYTEQKIEKEKLETIVEAGLFAPNPGGRQGTRILLLDDAEMIEKIGIVNANCENRNWDIGVSKSTSTPESTATATIPCSATWRRLPIRS